MVRVERNWSSDLNVRIRVCNMWRAAVRVIEQDRSQGGEGAYVNDEGCLDFWS